MHDDDDINPIQNTVNGFLLPYGAPLKKSFGRKNNYASTALNLWNNMNVNKGEYMNSPSMVHDILTLWGETDGALATMIAQLPFVKSDENVMYLREIKRYVYGDLDSINAEGHLGIINRPTTNKTVKYTIFAYDNVRISKFKRDINYNEINNVDEDSLFLNKWLSKAKDDLSEVAIPLCLIFGDIVAQ